MSIPRSPNVIRTRLCLRVQLLTTALALALSARPVDAQQPDAGPEAAADSELESELDYSEWISDGEGYETVVHDYRIRPTDETTTFAETLDVSESARSADSVADVLGEAVGLQIRQLGGMGSYGAASIRGSTPGQVPVYLDGVQLNSGGFPTVDMGDLSLDTLESIEIYRGGAPVTLGLSGIGGAISLHTREFDQPISEVALTGGSWGTARALVLHGNRIGKLSGLGILVAQGSQGNFEYLNRNGTLFNEEDDRFQRRKNNEHVAYGTLFKLDGPIGGWRWTAVNDFHLMHRGVPGIDSVPTVNSDLETMRDTLSVRVGGPLGDSSQQLHLDASYLVLTEDFTDLDNEIGLGHQRVRARSDSIGGGALLEIDWNKRNASGLRLGVRHERFRFEELVTSAAPEPSNRVRVESGVQHTWQIVDPLSLVPSFGFALHHSSSGGGRYAGELTETKAASDTSFFWMPALGARLEIAPGLFLCANGGRYFRAPDLIELYGDRGAVIGNPKLRPEVGYNADAGIRWIRTRGRTLSLLRLEAVWFGSWSRDLITYVQNSQNTIRPENVDAARILGGETSVSLKAADLISLQGNYTYLGAINRSDKPYHNGRFLPGKPAHEAYGKLELGQTRDYWGAAFWFDVNYAGENYLDQANLKRDSLARLLFGLGYRIERPRAGLTLTFEIKNLFDTKVLTDADGTKHPLRDYEAFPLPGRTVLVTLHWKA